MSRGSGSEGVVIGLLDGPVSTSHPDLAPARIRSVDDYSGVACTLTYSDACAHGTFIAGILAARRESRAPAICPGCTVLIRPIFQETTRDGRMPTATPDEVAQAILESVGAGARILNLSAATGGPSTRAEPRLEEALDYAASRGVVIVAAAGNQAALGSSVITRHHAVVPVVAYDRRGWPLSESNLGGSIGRRGLGAPGEGIESLGPAAGTRIAGGTSSASAFVTGALALLWSLFPEASGTELKRAVTDGGRRKTVTPPLLNADAALEAMERANGKVGVS
jgi:subtilisin family serine protease